MKKKIPKEKRISMHLQTISIADHFFNINPQTLRKKREQVLYVYSRNI